MNLRTYYEKVHKIREGLKEPYVYLTSLATPNGGKEGVVTEVAAELAARMLADGLAREAEEHEILAHQKECETQREAAREEQLRNRLRITLVSDPEIQLAGEMPAAKQKNRS